MRITKTNDYRFRLRGGMQRNGSEQEITKIKDKDKNKKKKKRENMFNKKGAFTAKEK